MGGRLVVVAGGDVSVWVWSRRGGGVGIVGRSACSSCVGPHDSTQEASEWKTLPRQEEINSL